MTVDICVSGWASSNRSWYRPWGILECTGILGDTELEGCVSDFYRVCNEEKLKEDDEESGEDDSEGEDLDDDDGNGSGGEGEGEEVELEGNETARQSKEQSKELGNPMLAPQTARGCISIQGERKKKKATKKKEKPNFIENLLLLFKDKTATLINTIFSKYDANPLNLTPFLNSDKAESTSTVELSVGSDCVDVMKGLGFSNFPTFVTAVVPNRSLRSNCYTWSLTRPSNVHLTVKWEPDVISKISHTFLTSEAVAMVAEASLKEGLKHTLAASLMTAAAVPIALGRWVNGIDDDWVLACARADRVGILLARSWCENGVEKELEGGGNGKASEKGGGKEATDTSNAR